MAQGPLQQLRGSDVVWYIAAITESTLRTPSRHWRSSEIPADRPPWRACPLRRRPSRPSAALRRAAGLDRLHRTGGLASIQQQRPPGAVTPCSGHRTDRRGEFATSGSALLLIAVKSRRQEGEEREDAAMETEKVEQDSVRALALRVERLEHAVAGRGDEVRTRRLVVVDHQGTERIVDEVVPDGSAEVRMDLPGQPAGARTALLLFANPGEEASGLPSGVGVQVWVDGDAVRELGAWSDTDE